MREQLAELLRLDMDPFALQYQEDPNHSCHFAFLSDSSLPSFERSVLECIKKLPAEVLYYRQLLRDKEALMETLKRRERLKTLTANALKTSAAVSGFSRDIEEQRKEIKGRERT